MRKNKSKKNKVKDSKKKKSFYTTKDLLTLKNYDDEIEAFELNDGSYFDIFRIVNIDRENTSQESVKMYILSFMMFLRTYSQDIKLFVINFNINNNIQKEYTKNLISRTLDPIRKSWLKRDLKELEHLEEFVVRREFFVKVFGEDRNKFIKNKEDFLKNSYTKNIGFFEELSKNEKIQIEKKLHNMNTLIQYSKDDEVTLSQIAKIFNINKNKKDTSENVDIVKEVQPKGGITFKDPKIIHTGDGYVRCLQLYEMPSLVRDFWLDRLVNIPDTIVTIDIHTDNINDVKRNINKSIQSEISNKMNSKQFDEIFDAESRNEKLQEMFDLIEHSGEILKYVDFKIFVASKSLLDLDEKVANILDLLEGSSYKFTTPIYEGKNTYLSLDEPYTKQHDKTFSLDAQPLLTEPLAGGFPFNYCELLDPHGVFLGATTSEGVVLFDDFHVTNRRSYYNSLVCGELGSGKSTYLKKRFRANASRGNFIRTFDVTGEFESLTKEFGGKIIKCNGTDGILNVLEILKAGEDDDSSFANHLQKVKIFFKILNDENDFNENLFENLLRKFYESYNLVPKRGVITGLSPDRYPILSDFLSFLEDEIEAIKKGTDLTEIEKEMESLKAKNLDVFREICENLVNNYGKMFNGITSVDNIVDEKIVTFDISEIKGLNNLFVAQMSNFISLCWDNALTNGIIMKDLYEKGEDIANITKFLVIIDEAHTWVNPNIPILLIKLIKYARESRKYFAGLLFASQSLRDFFPESKDKNIELIKSLFQLTQYKVMFRQSGGTTDLIKKILGSDLTYSQLLDIPRLDKGKMILSISGDRSLLVDVWLSKEYEEPIFSGGR